jgi:vesicle transport protein SEC22
MSKTARLYRDTRSATASSENNLDKLNGELQDVTRIMTKNMEELLWRGDSLDSAFPIYTRDNFVHLPSFAGMSHLSTSLRSESAKYRKAARNINTQGAFIGFCSWINLSDSGLALIRKWAPVGAVGLFILVFIYAKFF